ncbi:MAG TPA: VWA domain-containing protein [Terriglobales bacterium]|nr:VWA domain-containing protein [Terriglobales bacterium]
MMTVLGEIGRTAVVFLVCAGLLGPGSLALSAQQSQQNIPDAPSAGRTPQQLPSSGPAMPGPQDEAAPPPQSAPDNSSSDGTPDPAHATPPPNANPPSSTDNSGVATTRDGMFTMVVNTNFVTVPVTVKDPSGHLVEGLTMKDFTLYEDGTKQPLKLFTSDPFPLSAAVIFDLSLPESEVRKVNQTLPALTGSFSQFDEVSLYAYGNTVARVSDFTAIGEKLNETLRTYREDVRGRADTVPVMTGPMAQQGPIVNGHPMDPGAPQVPVMQRESHVLNDAVLMAARDLAKRDRTRRKIIFIVSDGRESGSNASYSDVLKVLLSQEIQVYAVAVGSSAIPGYGELQKIKIPRFGYGDILPKYASATGGEVLSEFSRDAIEAAYSRITGQARNQYTLGYLTRATPSSTYKVIEVRVHRPGLKVTARDGYYPLPPAPRANR